VVGEWVWGYAGGRVWTNAAGLRLEDV
jgi:hypothetical protein